MTPWQAGTKLGPYEILAQIGVGGMGVVEPFRGRPSPQAKSRAERVVCVPDGFAERGI
jgi:hypothetical protein